MDNFTPVQKSHIWLNSFEDLTNKNYNLLMQRFGSSVDIVKSFVKEKGFIEPLLGAVLYNKMCCNLSGDYLYPKLLKLQKSNINVITAEDNNYPQDLLQFDDRPFLLYTLGNIMLLNTPMVTVVGSRKCTRYGIEQTAEIVKGLSGYGFTIVSGLAEGIDTKANSTALEKGKTVAVLAGGFDCVYPKSNLKLFEKIKENGLLISQYPPEKSAMPYMFPLRNRIMSAISCATVLVEAGESSGALITANLSLNLGKELFILPGNVNSCSSKGSNKMLKEMQGAMITGYKDILQGLGIEIKDINENCAVLPDLTEDERVIYNMLSREEEHIDDIINKTGFDISKTNTVLTILEIKGLIKKLPGNRFGI